MFFEWSVALRVCLLCFTLLNLISWPKLTATFLELAMQLSRNDAQSRINEIRSSNGDGTECCCFSLERSPLNISSLSNICLHVIAQYRHLYGNFKSNNKSNNAFPTRAYNVHKINLPFLCSHSAIISFRISFLILWLYIMDYFFRCI